jgi:RNA polymerase primary sigma factor
MLLEKADVQGYLTTDDLIELMPDASKDSERLESIMITLRRRGIEILDQDSVLPEEDDTAPVTDMNPYTDLSPISSDDTIGLYLKEMARVALLSVEEEISLARRIELGRSARVSLERSKAKERIAYQTGALTPAVERAKEGVIRGTISERRRSELIQHVEDGELAREHLIKANTRLVVSIAKRYVGRGVPFLDLIQEGNLGLMKAVEKYEYQRGFRFSTYATWWIRQTITRAIADQGRTIRVPVHMVDRIRQLYKTSHELEQTLGRSPTIEELAERVGLQPEKVDWMMQVSWLPLSLESPINEDEEEAELGMFVEDELTPTPIQSAYSKLLSEKIQEVLDTLPPREARILRLRFGLENGRSYTLEEVGQKFGLTRERIRQIESKALRRLRHPRRSRQLRDYLQ